MKHMRWPETVPFALLLCLWQLGGGPALRTACAQSCIWTAQPASPTVCVGDTFQLSVGVGGAGGTNTYQWFHNNVPVGGNSPSITVTNATLTDAGPYKCRVIRSGFPPCDQYSNVGNVTVNVPPMAQADSDAQLFCNNVNTPFHLRVLATSGTAPLTYRWHRNGAAITDGGRFGGTGTAEFVCYQPFSGDTGGTWSCLVSNSCGSVMVTVPSPVQSGPPPIAPLPDLIAVVAGGPFSLTGVATGVGVNDYRWYVNGVRLVNNFGEPFSTYYGPGAGQYTLWTGALSAATSDAQLELRLINTCYDSNSAFVRLLTGDAAESEPNNAKGAADAFQMVDGCRIVGSAGGGDIDYYRLESPPSGGAIHRRTVRLESPDGTHSVSIAGLQQTGGVVTNQEVTAQAGTTIDGFTAVRYYTCGEGQPSYVYVVVRGSDAGGATATPYRLTLLDEPQATAAIPGPPLEPATPFTISLAPAAGTFDTDLWCTDAAGNALTGFGNDDTGASPASVLTRTTGGPGVSMRIALSRFNLANSLSSPPDDARPNGNVVDSPNVTLASSVVPPPSSSMTLRVTQNGVERTAPVDITDPLQVLWFDLPVRTCSPADLGSAGGLAGPDGTLNNNDFIVFIDDFFNGVAAADMGTQGGLPGTDGQFNNNDFVVFVDLFFAGCN